MAVKVGIMDQYRAFPWQGQEGLSLKSSPDWLMFHLFTALLQMCATANRICPKLPDPIVILIKGVYPNDPKESFIARIEVLRWVLGFCFNVQILMNLGHLGPFQSFNAILINGFILCLSTFLGRYQQTKAYFAIITLPIALEFCQAISLIGIIQVAFLTSIATALEYVTRTPSRST